MRATKLNAQVQLTNLQTMCERGTATSDQRRQLALEYQDWARLQQGRGPEKSPAWEMVCLLSGIENFWTARRKRRMFIKMR